MMEVAPFCPLGGVAFIRVFSQPLMKIRSLAQQAFANRHFSMSAFHPEANIAEQRGGYGC